MLKNHSLYMEKINKIILQKFKTNNHLLLRKYCSETLFVLPKVFK